MAVQVILGSLRTVLSKGGLGRAVRVVAKARRQKKSTPRALSRVFAEMLPDEISALWELAKTAEKAAKTAQAAPLNTALRDFFPAITGAPLGGDLEGAIGRIAVKVSNPFGDGVVNVVLNPESNLTKAQIIDRATRKAAAVIRKYPEKFGFSPGEMIDPAKLREAMKERSEIVFEHIEVTGL